MFFLGCLQCTILEAIECFQEGIPVYANSCGTELKRIHSVCIKFTEDIKAIVIKYWWAS